MKELMEYTYFELCNFTVRELRELLIPYGTPYRLSLSRAELLRKIRDIRDSELAGNHGN